MRNAHTFLHTHLKRTCLPISPLGRWNTKKEPIEDSFLQGFLVPKVRLELTHISAYAPEAYVSTNFTTWASVLIVSIF